MEAFTKALYILDDIRRKLPDDLTNSRLDELECLCRAYMELDQDNPGRRLGMTRSENKMFRLLLARRGQTVSKGALLDACLHQCDKDPEIKIIDVHLSHLRRKLAGSEYENMIETVWGLGYRLRTEAEGPLVINDTGWKVNKYRAVAA